MRETIEITRVQRFCTQDGPGARTTVFMKGCPLRCRWCHNPEAQRAEPELLYAERLCVMCGQCARACERGAHIFADGRHLFEASRCDGCGKCALVCPTGACEAASEARSAVEIARDVERDRAFYGREGGLTLSGGEPTFQRAGCLALLRAARAAGINTALETCGYFAADMAAELMPLVDLFLWDYKDSDPARHLEYTGVSNERILANLRALDGLGARVRLRCVMVAGVNLNEEHLEAIAGLYHELQRCEGVDLLPCHAYGSSKAAQLGRAAEIPPEWLPSEGQMARAREFLRARGVPVGGP